MAIEFEVSAVVPSRPEKIYQTWLDSDGHTQITGGAAKVSAEVGGTFEAWDGYITGTNLVLESNKRIVQTWRTMEFTDDEGDSQVEILFEAVEGGTKVTLIHTNLPAHGMQYKQGWVDNYFEPMQRYFGK